MARKLLLQAILTADPETVALVIMEPVQNSGGAFTPPEGYFEGVRAICDRYGILLCADEVICGFGRLGAWFGSERYDIRPDLITETRETFDAEECETLLRGFLSPRLFERGLICRTDDRGDPVVQVSPPLIAQQEQFDEIVGILGDVLADAGEQMRR